MLCFLNRLTVALLALVSCDRKSGIAGIPPEPDEPPPTYTHRHHSPSLLTATGYPSRGLLGGLFLAAVLPVPGRSEPGL